MFYDGVWGRFWGLACSSLGVKIDVLFGYRRLVRNDREDPGAIRLENAGVDFRGRDG